MIANNVAFIFSPFIWSNLQVKCDTNEILFNNINVYEYNQMLFIPWFEVALQSKWDMIENNVTLSKWICAFYCENIVNR